MTASLRRTWTLWHTVMLALLLAAGGWVHREALRDILAIGVGYQEQSHILLAPLMAGWLFWLRRSRLRSLRSEPSLWGPVLIALGIVMGWAATGMGAEVVWHAGALVTLVGCVATMTGLGFIRQFAPAFAALVFLIPVPATVRHAIGIPLQAVATGVTQAILEVIGVPATREGFTLVINGEHIAVGEACNGMRMVFALALVVYAFVFSTRLRPSMWVVLLVLSPFMALLCNVIRLIPTTVIYGYGTPGTAEVFHDLSGWVMLPLALLMLLGVLRLFRWIEIPVMAFRLALR